MNKAYVSIDHTSYRPLIEICLHQKEHLSPAETNFLDNLERWAYAHKNLSPKQELELTKILVKLEALNKVQRRAAK